MTPITLSSAAGKMRRQSVNSAFWIQLNYGMMIWLCVLFSRAQSSYLPYPLEIGQSYSENEQSRTPVQDINVFILLPQDERYMASIKYTGPAMNIGWEQVQQLQLLSGYRINLNYRDTNCSNILAPMEAIRACVSNTVHVFFGPSCELALGKPYCLVIIYLSGMGTLRVSAVLLAPYCHCVTR